MTKNGLNDENGPFGRKNEIDSFWWKTDKIFEISDEIICFVVHMCQVLYNLQWRLIDIISESSLHFALFTC